MYPESPTTIPLGVLRELYNYNYWARDLQLKACSALTVEQFLRPLGGSFSSIRDTLAHLVDNEAYNLQRWRGRSREQIEAALGGSRVEDRAKNWPDLFPSLSQLERRWREVEHEVRAFLGALTEADLSHEVTYVDSAGRRWTYALWRMLLHVVNHQTYHRGQITVFLRQLRLSAPPTDYLVGLHTGFAM